MMGSFSICAKGLSYQKKNWLGYGSFSFSFRFIRLDLKNKYFLLVENTKALLYGVT